MDARAMVCAERDAYVATLQSLRPDQWSDPSLCEGWTVTDVVAHNVSGFEVGPGTALPLLLRNRFDLDKAAAALVARYSSWPADRLVARLAATDELTGLAKLLGWKRLLPDLVCHHQDVRRPTRLALHTPPAEALQAALATTVASNAGVKAKSRAKGLRLEATDVEWSHGTGPLVRGPGLDLLLALSGRPIGLAGLEGDGVATLAGRMNRANPEGMQRAG